MKKLGIIAIIAILILSLAACGKKKDKQPNTTDGNESTMPTLLDPTIMDPTMDTNIPDPSVDTRMPE